MTHADEGSPALTDPLGDAMADADGNQSTGTVRADHVELTQGGAQSIEATTVNVSQGGAGRINAEEVSIRQGGAGLVQTESLQLQEGASVFAVLADEATVAEGASVFMLFARSVSGGVRPILDWRAAAALGAGFGIVFAVLRRRGGSSGSEPTA